MPTLVESSIRITRQNVGDYEMFHRELYDHLQELIELTLKYPVEVEFQELRFVFDSEADIRSAIALLAAQIGKFKNAA